MYCPAEEVQIFIFLRFVYVVACSKVADYFVHHTEGSTEQQGSLFMVHLLSNKGILIQCIMRIVAVVLCRLHVRVFMFYLSE